MRIQKNWGLLLLSIFLVVTGIVGLIGGGGALGIILAILAIASGVLIFIDK